MAFTIDYQPRIDDVLSVLKRDFGVVDTDAALLLLAARIKPACAPPVWICLETEYYAREKQDIEAANTMASDAWHGWFAFGRETVNLAHKRRCNRPRLLNWITFSILQSRDMPRAFVEPEYRAPVKVWHTVRMWPYLQQVMPRLRASSQLGATPDQSARARLKQAADRALDPQFREPIQRIEPLPEYWTAKLELLQRLNPLLRDWASLYTAFATMRHCLKALPAGDQLLDRLMERLWRDSVPWWTQRILASAAPGNMTFTQIQRGAKLGGETMKDERKLVQGENLRLRRAEVLGYERSRFWIKDPLALEMYSTT